MKNHELICTANPLRECGFCRIMGEDQENIQNLKCIIERNIQLVSENEGEFIIFKGIPALYPFAYNIEDERIIESEVLKELRESANGCPVCMLSAMRQTKTAFLFNSFDYKAEKEVIYQDFMDNQQDYY